ncbi:MAG: HAMP domain-containing histidine kinase [Candidatus Daviesbacteria bacterium]|nr:HAMP domain-containing histidine kinase [Candidatus Daviesbacteria bacterium]
MTILISIGLLVVILIINFFYNKKTRDLEERNKRLTVLTQENDRVNQELRNTLTLLARANDRLKELDHLKDDFVSIASHELRTPMTAIRSYAWMALHRSDVPLSKTVEKYLVRVLISSERLINLVNDMLNVSRIEANKIEINPESIYPLLLIKDIVDEVYYSKSQEKTIQFEVLEKQCPKIFADPEKLRQVFLNLVGNSLKFTPHGGKISFDFFSDGKTVEIAVSDTGIGISRDDLSKLFHKFSRLDNSYTATATSGGTGLGLYISKSLLELMHGKIRVYSEGANKGSRFIVSLPVATQENLQHKASFSIKPKGEVKGLEPVAI